MLEGLGGELPVGHVEVLEDEGGGEELLERRRDLAFGFPAAEKSAVLSIFTSGDGQPP